MKTSRDRLYFAAGLAREAITNNLNVRKNHPAQDYVELRAALLELNVAIKNCENEMKNEYHFNGG